MVYTMYVLLFLAGLVMTVVSVFYMKDIDIINNPLNQNKILNAEKKLKEKLDEIDKMMEELNKFANHVNDELSQKHKELLFLYQMIDEKYDSATSMPTYKVNARDEEVQKKNIEIEKVEEPIAKPEKKTQSGGYSDIYSLHEDGKSVDEIAKELNIGKGEVKLLLELTQKR